MSKYFTSCTEKKSICFRHFSTFTCLLTCAWPEHLPDLKKCHVVGNAPLYEYWPNFVFPPAVGKSDTIIYLASSASVNTFVK